MLYAQYDSISDFYTIETALLNTNNGAALLIPAPATRTKNTVFELTFRRLANDGTKGMIGRGYNISITPWYRAFKDCTGVMAGYYNNVLGAHFDYGFESGWDLATVNVGTVTTVKLGWGRINLAGTTYTRTPPVDTPAVFGDIGLFGYYDAQSDSFASVASYGIYSLDIYEDDGSWTPQLYHAKYRPATRISDSELGLVDLMSGTFLTNLVAGQNFSIE